MPAQTVADVVGHGREGIRLQGQGARKLHPVLGNAHVNGRGDYDLGEEIHRGLVAHVQGAGRVVFHGQVLVVLLGAAGGQNSPLDLPGLGGDADLPAGHLPKSYFSGFHVRLPMYDCWLTVTLRGLIMHNQFNFDNPFKGMSHER